jgi:hypothetical protein
MGGLPEQETENAYVVSEDQILQPPTTSVGQVESEIVYLFYILVTTNITVEI